MRKKSILVLSAIFVLVALVLSSCDILFDGEEEIDAELLVQTSVAQTLAAQGETPVVQPTDTVPPEATATSTLTPTMTLTPTETLTPTPSTPVVQVDVDTNCRSGPGTVYERLGGLLVGEEAEVIGEWDVGDYWIIPNPDGPGDCWLWGRYATVEGPTGDLPRYTQPPTPTPDIDWSGTWTTAYGPPGGPYETYTVTVTQAGSDVTGYYVDSDTGRTVNLSGSLSADFMTWTGNWDDGFDTGPFLWHWLNPNQFNGNRDSGSYAWCGYRNSAGQPSPCQYP